MPIIMWDGFNCRGAPLPGVFVDGIFEDTYGEAMLQDPHVEMFMISTGVD